MMLHARSSTLAIVLRPDMEALPGTLHPTGRLAMPQLSANSQQEPMPRDYAVILPSTLLSLQRRSAMSMVR